jgi:general secretion pathway protein J
VTRRGLTLLELLVALSMAAVLSLALYAALAAAFEMREAVARQTQGATAATIAIEVLAADFANAQAYSPSGEPAFFGEATSVEVVALLSGPPTPGLPDDAVRRVRLFLQDDRLIRTQERNVFSLDTEAPPEQILLTGVQDLRLRYLGQEDWLDVWDGIEAELPRAVEITLTLDTVDEPYEAVHVVPITPSGGES